MYAALRERKDVSMKKRIRIYLVLCLISIISWFGGCGGGSVYERKLRGTSAEMALQEDRMANRQSSLQNNGVSAGQTLRELMEQIKSGAIRLDELNDEEYIHFATEVCGLVCLEDEAPTEELHFFRNRFDRAPVTLRDMTDTILYHPGNPFGWYLVPPDSNYYHMDGLDGEYNMKFLSADGHFEAVYNREGVLLTAASDPRNMGTFNYADPVSNLGKHAAFDVSPYLAWGNVPDSQPVDKAYRTDMKTKYETNPDAERHYEMYRNLLSG